MSKRSIADTFDEGVESEYDLSKRSIADTFDEGVESLYDQAMKKRKRLTNPRLPVLGIKY